MPERSPTSCGAVGADPAAIDVRRGADLAVFDDAGQRESHRPCAAGQLAHELLEHRQHGRGVEGCGVGAEIKSPTRRPASTSTSPALIDEPPTSIPNQIGASCQSFKGWRRPRAACRAHGVCSGSASRSRTATMPDATMQHHDGGERVDVRADTRAGPWRR